EEGAAADVLVGVLRADDEDVVVPGEGRAVGRLEGTSRGEDVVEEAGIRGELVHVELLALERAHEGVRIERPVLPERLPRVQDRQVESGGEEVAGREVE